MTWKDLEAVYNHLKSMGECHTQKEFADIIGQSPENVSKKLGTLNPVMPKTVYKIKEKYSHVFNESWIMNGEGDMLKPVLKPEVYKAMSAEEERDYMIRMNEWLRKQLDDEREEKRKLIERIERLENKINKISAGPPLEYYQVADGDINPATMNDEFTKYK